ncbi:cysteine desulfurase NifS [Candidatus Jorgensenbacteria bacterium RIFCSPLOWO2_12_FULL_42_11]|uniref:Cysteine desulfurase NifS n=1 Tax=Candidatus Jorgensenbacteria bacterium RIFCSPLOWO2_12_FULL_42_11 TaxID=1798473 RepID=A0A1F6C2S2_9BACT|nr:MAG: cysteine desulfurase NifS [Candidatus Jorgensenbacteria bacterium RIFCSPLOWO2_12_FULL_42_11]
MKKLIYLDHAATTPLSLEVKTAMEPFWSENFGNPSSIYQLGIRAKSALSQARQKIAKILGAKETEIIFTAGGTESANVAILGLSRAIQKTLKKPGHIITTKIEHPAVLNAVLALKKEGFAISVLPVDKHGLVSLEKIKKTVKPETFLISVMYANNEIGTIEPIIEIGKLLKKINQKRKADGLSRIYFHTDACQAAGYLDIKVDKLGVDLLTFNGSKIYGPKGSAVLYIRNGVSLKPLIFGGGQENGLRSGTENVPAYIGLAKALELVQKNKNEEIQRLNKLSQKLIDGILKSISKTFLNGHPQKRLPNNVNITILDIEGEALLLYLDHYGICASTGSACHSQNLQPSHVLQAIGLPREIIHGSLRLTLGQKTTNKDIDYVLKVLPDIVKKLRELSPINISLKNG